MSMTDEQIIEALEYCVSTKSCEECPICNTDNCGFVLMRNALDLIKRQQAEIEELKKVGNKIDSLGLVATLIDQRERLVRTKYEWEREVRAEAAREFAKKLKSRIRKDIDEQGMFPLPYTKKAYDTVMIFIDNLVKEMMGDNK